MNQCSRYTGGQKLVRGTYHSYHPTNNVAVKITASKKLNPQKIHVPERNCLMVVERKTFKYNLKKTFKKIPGRNKNRVQVHRTHPSSSQKKNTETHIFQEAFNINAHARVKDKLQPISKTKHRLIHSTVLYCIPQAPCTGRFPSLLSCCT